MYDSALVKFRAEIDKLDASINSIQDGHFLKALVREELKQDTSWVVRLRSLPQTPETYYLLELQHQSNGCCKVTAKIVLNYLNSAPNSCSKVC